MERIEVRLELIRIANTRCPIEAVAFADKCESFIFRDVDKEQSPTDAVKEQHIEESGSPKKKPRGKKGQG